MRKSKILEHALLNDSLLYGNTRGDYHQLNSLTVLLCLEVMMYVPQDHQRIFFLFGHTSINICFRAAPLVFTIAALTFGSIVFVVYLINSM
jgi:hypothetical protein